MPEETDDYIRIPVAECKITATIDISKSDGIKALYCGGDKKVATYLFQKDKGWTMAKAKEWVEDHKEEKAHPHGEHVCECPECGKEITVEESVKCNEQKCPECGTRMRAKEIGERRPKGNSNRQIEYRTFDLDDIEVRSEDDKPKIRGHAAIFNKLSEDLFGFREMIMPGAFTEAMRKDDVRALFNHDPNYILGRTKAGTLHLEEDDKGLAIEIDPPDTSYAKDLLVSIKRGDISQMSFAFNLRNNKGEEWDKTNEKMPIRKVLNIKLYDVSPVTYPAYPQTDVKVRTSIGEDALAVIEKAERGEELDDEEQLLIKNTIDKLSGYIPEPPELVTGGAPDEGYVQWLGKIRRELELAELF